MPGRCGTCLPVGPHRPILKSLESRVDSENIVVARGRGVAGNIRPRGRIQAHRAAAREIGPAADALPGTAAAAGRAACGRVTRDRAAGDGEGADAEGCAAVVID